MWQTEKKKTSKLLEKQMKNKEKTWILSIEQGDKPIK